MIPIRDAQKRGLSCLLDQRGHFRHRGPPDIQLVLEEGTQLKYANAEAILLRIR
jgi:hypothetical protein